MGKFLFVAVILILISIAGVFYFSNSSSSVNKHTVSNKNDDKQLSQTTSKMVTCSIFGQNIQISKQSENELFTSALTNTGLIDHISPGDQTGDKRFTYLWIKNGQGVPIFAPANGTLVQIIYKTRTDLGAGMSAPDYDLVFLVNCNTFYRINHITDPNPEIRNQSPITKPMELKPGSGVNDNDTKPKENIEVKAGEQIGTTTGTPTAHNFDFGIFVNQQATCPYNEFPEPIKATFLALFKGSTCSPSGSY